MDTVSLIIQLDLDIYSHVEKVYIFEMIKPMCLYNYGATMIINKALAAKVYCGDIKYDLHDKWLMKLLIHNYNRLKPTVCGFRNHNPLRAYHEIYQYEQIGDTDYIIYYIPMEI